MDKLTKEQQKKKKKDTNFNELPDDLPLLKEKSRTSGKMTLSQVHWFAKFMCIFCRRYISARDTV